MPQITIKLSKNIPYECVDWDDMVLCRNTSGMLRSAHMFTNCAPFAAAVSVISPWLPTTPTRYLHWSRINNSLIKIENKLHTTGKLKGMLLDFYNGICIFILYKEFIKGKNIIENTPSPDYPCMWASPVTRVGPYRTLNSWNRLPSTNRVITCNIHW